MKQKYKLNRVRLTLVRESTKTYEGPPLTPVHSSSIAFNLVRSWFAGLAQEHMGCLALDNQNNPVAFAFLAQGALNTLKLKPAIIARFLCAANCESFILVHNHPSGITTPSPEDLQFTTSLKEILKPIGFVFFDHLIVTDDAYTSIRALTGNW